MKLLHDHLTGLDREGQAYCVSIHYESGGVLSERDVLKHDKGSLLVRSDNAAGDIVREDITEFVNLRYVRQVTVIEL